MVDELGGIDRAIELVKKRARIPANENVNLVMYPPKRSIFEVLFPQQTSEAVMDARINLVPGLRDAHLKVWMRGGMLRMMPFTPVFR